MPSGVEPRSRAFHPRSHPAFRRGVMHIKHSSFDALNCGRVRYSTVPATLGPRARACTPLGRHPLGDTDGGRRAAGVQRYTRGAGARWRARTECGWPHRLAGNDNISEETLETEM